MREGSKGSEASEQAAKAREKRRRIATLLGALGLLAVMAALTLMFMAPEKELPQSAESAPAEAVGARSKPASLIKGTPAKPPPSQQSVQQRMVSLPLRFERNEGQFDEGVRYIARAEGLMLSLTDEGPTMYLRTGADKSDEPQEADEQADEDEEGHAKALPPGLPKREKAGTMRAVRMRVANAAKRPAIVASDEVATKTNYYVGKDKRKWRANVANYGRVTYREVLPGIDVVYHGDGRKLEYDFVVAPGVSPDAIAIDFEGADSVEHNEEGQLELAVADRTLIQHKPFIYQEIDGTRRQVDGAFKMLGEMRVGFEIAEYDRSRPLVIDPTVVFATYLGGSLNEQIYDIAVTPTDQIAVVGRTQSANFPLESAFDSTNVNSSEEAFVTLLDPDGAGVVFSTYVGGVAQEQGYAVAASPTGDVFAGGNTWSNDFPISGGFDAAIQGNEGFISVLTASVREALLGVA